MLPYTAKEVADVFKISISRWGRLFQVIWLGFYKGDREKGASVIRRAVMTDTEVKQLLPLKMEKEQAGSLYV